MSTSSHASFFTRSVQFPFLFLASILFFLSLLPAFAQEAPEQESRGVISPISVSDVEVIEANKERFVVQATFTNTSKTKPVTGVYTTVALLEKAVKKKVNGAVIVELSIFDEARMEDLFLAPGESSTRKMTYSPPSFAKGSYELRVFIRDDLSKREIASESMPSEMPLIGTGMYLSLSDCFLTVKGEEKKYKLREGVDIDANETLLLNCTAENRTGAPVENATLTFTLHDRIGTGAIVKGVDAQPTTLSFKKDEKREVSFPLPIPQRPQAYNAVSKITASTNKDTPIANEISTYFIVRGLSATIQKVSLDTFSFTKGSIAKLSFEWTGPADDFPSFRRGENVPGTKLPDTLSATAQIVRNKNDAACSEEKRISLSTTSNPGSPLSNASDISVTADCPDPVVILKIVSGTTVLSEGRYVFGTNAPEEKVIPSTFSKNPLFYGIVIVIALLALFALYYAVRREGRKNLSLLVFILGSAVFLFGGGEAYARYDCGSANLTDAPEWAEGPGFWFWKYPQHYDEALEDFTSWTEDATKIDGKEFCTGADGKVRAVIHLRAHNTTNFVPSMSEWFRVYIYKFTDLSHSPLTGVYDYKFEDLGPFETKWADVEPEIPSLNNLFVMVQSRHGELPTFDDNCGGSSSACSTWYPVNMVCDDFQVKALPADDPKCCIDTTWSPDPGTVCNNQLVKRTSNCGTEEWVPGTKVCDGSCGTLARSYPAETISWPGGTWCAVGTKHPAGATPFPEPGGSVSWTCKGLTGAEGSVGDDSDPCVANREVPTLPPACGPNQRFYSDNATNWYDPSSAGFCSSGTPPSPLPSFPAPWTCGGTSSISCSASIMNTTFQARTTTDMTWSSTSTTGVQGDSLDFQWTVTPDSSMCTLSGPGINRGPLSGDRQLINEFILGPFIPGGDYTLQCTYEQPDEDAVSQKTVNVTATCTPTAWSPWGNCAPACDDDEKGDQKRTRINGSCEVETESQPCNVPKCQPGGFKEIRPTSQLRIH